MNPTGRTIVLGVATGAIASWAKTKMEPPLQRGGERLVEPTPEEKSLPGADVIGHPEWMPPAVLARRVGRFVLGTEPGDDETATAMNVTHYAFGVGFGVAYCAAARRHRSITVGFGVPAGAVLWASTHGSTLPLLRLQAPPWKMPASWYCWELGSHLGFGLVLEAGRRTILDLLNGR